MSEQSLVSAAPALTVKDLRVAFRRGKGLIDVVRGVTITVGQGELVGLVGESGSGKSVTGRAILGILDERRTRVRASRIAVSDSILMSEEGVRRGRPGHDGVAMVFQNPFTSLNPVFQIGTLLTEVLRRHGVKSPREAQKRAVQLLDSVRVPDPPRRLRAYPHELSGGMQQRVGIALALAASPRVIIADEPTTALDVTIQAQIIELLMDLRSRLGVSVLFISHDLTLVAEVARRVYVMYAGRIAETGFADVLRSGAAHPYTRGLISAVPSLGETAGRLPTIPGSPPVAGSLVRGCPFAPRCGRRSSVCEAQEPNLSEVAGDQLAACHHPAVGEEVAP